MSNNSSSIGMIFAFSENFVDFEISTNFQDNLPLERLGLERPGSLLKSFVRLDEFSETVHGILMKLDTYVHLTVRFYKKLSGHLWHLWFKCHAHLKIPMLSLWRFYKVLQNLIFIKNPLLDFNYNFFKSKAQNVC